LNDRPAWFHPLHTELGGLRLLPGDQDRPRRQNPHRNRADERTVLAQRRADHAVTLFDSFVFRPKAGTDAVLLAQALASQMYGVIRAKGFICNQDGRYTLLQVVGSRWQLAAVPEGSAPIVTARSSVLACEVGWIRMGSCVCTVRGLGQFRLISASG